MKGFHRYSRNLIGSSVYVLQKQKYESIWMSNLTSVKKASTLSCFSPYFPLQCILILLVNDICFLGMSDKPDIKIIITHSNSNNTFPRSAVFKENYINSLIPVTGIKQRSLHLFCSRSTKSDQDNYNWTVLNKIAEVSMNQKGKVILNHKEVCYLGDCNKPIAF